jgi:hypothetical protein
MPTQACVRDLELPVHRRAAELLKESVRPKGASRRSRVAATSMSRWLKASAFGAAQCAERVAPEIGVVALVVDDTGIPKDGKH